MAKLSKGDGSYVKIMLTHAQMFRVMLKTQESFVDSDLTDAEFAEKLSAELGFPVSESSIATARKAFDIPSRKEIRGKIVQTTPEARLAALEAKVAAMDKFLAGYFKDDNYTTGPLGK